MILLAPTPSLMNSRSIESTLEPSYDCSNFSSWFRGVLGAYPASKSFVAEYLADVIPDFQKIENKAMHLMVQFSSGSGQPMELDFEGLSDGECFIRNDRDTNCRRLF
jgi:hypothetical protein